MGIGALIGAAFGAIGGGIAAGMTIFGLTMSWSVGMMLGGSIGALFDKSNLDFGVGTNTPNYAFGTLSNTKTQLLPVPIVYGRCRVAGNIILQIFDDDSKSKMDMFVAIGEGPINKVVRVSVDNHILYGDGADLGVTYWVLERKVPQPNGGTASQWTEVAFDYWDMFSGTKEMRDSNGDKTKLKLKDCSVDVHLGTRDQLPDKRDPETFSYANTAYVALSIKAQQDLSGNPTVTSIVEGRIVWTPYGERFSRNPAWIVLDLITNTRYGVGLPMDMIDLDSFRSVASYCDEVIDGNPRYQLDYIIDQQRPATDTLQDMLSTFQAYIQYDNLLKLAIDRQESTYTRELTTDHFIEGSFAWWTKSDDERYNRIVIEWVDPDLSYERSSAVFEDQADITMHGIKEYSVSLLGITNPGQVGRIGAYLLETARNIRIHCSFSVGINALDVNIGDVVAITYPEFTGWNKKWFRVQSLTENDQGQVELVCVEYSSTIYTAPGLPFDRGKDIKPPVEREDIHNLILTLQGRIESDGTYIPDALAEWLLPTTYTPRSIEVRYTYIDDDDGGWIIADVLPGDAKACLLKGLAAEKAASIHVRAIRPVDGSYTTGVIGQIFLSKDVLAPGPPTNLAAEGWFGSIYLTWKNPPDKDLSHIEVWEYHDDSLFSNDEGFEQKAVMVGRVFAESYERKLGSFQSRCYWVRAVDYSGNKSPFNLPEGTPGSSEQESHEDFTKELLQREEVAKVITTLNEPLLDLRGLFTEITASWEVFSELLNIRAQLKALAGATGDETFTAWEGWKYHNAIVQQEKTEREEQGLVLSELITSAIASIGDQTNPALGTVFAAIQEEMRARVTDDTAISEQISNLVAYIGDPNNPGGGTLFGAIEDVGRVMIGQSEVVTESISSLIATIGDKDNPVAGSLFAAIRDERTARVSSEESQAKINTTLQSQLSGNIASVQTIQNTVNGIQSDYVIKTDVNGHVVGMGILNQGIGRSAIVFHADSFLIGAPGGSTAGDYPFAMGYVNGQYRISMSNAFIQDAAISSAKIQDAAIGTAKIQDLSVDTLKIKGNAVTVPEYASGSVHLLGTRGSEVRVGYFSVGQIISGQPLVYVISIDVTGDNAIVDKSYFTVRCNGITSQTFDVPTILIDTTRTNSSGWKANRNGVVVGRYLTTSNETCEIGIYYRNPMSTGSGWAATLKWQAIGLHCKR